LFARSAAHRDAPDYGSRVRTAILGPRGISRGGGRGLGSGRGSREISSFAARHEPGSPAGRHHHATHRATCALLPIVRQIARVRAQPYWRCERPLLRAVGLLRMSRTLRPVRIPSAYAQTEEGAGSVGSNNARHTLEKPWALATQGPARPRLRWSRSLRITQRPWRRQQFPGLQERLQT
jgi:hypothetical protein